jgi:hypothetical protein
MSRHFTIAAIIATAAASAVLSQAIASEPTRADGSAHAARLSRLKQPAATTANVRGLRFLYGSYSTATPGGPGFLAYATVRCPRGTHAVGGGWDSTDSTPDTVTITSDEASRGLGGWIVGAIDESSSDSGAIGFSFRATVICG